jgi:hypothetical protein
MNHQEKLAKQLATMEKIIQRNKDQIVTQIQAGPGEEKVDINLNFCLEQMKQTMTNNKEDF